MPLIHYQFDPFVYARRRAEKGELQYGCAELIYQRSSSEVTASSRCSFSLMRARVVVATARVTNMAVGPKYYSCPGVLLPSTALAGSA